MKRFYVKALSLMLAAALAIGNGAATALAAESGTTAPNEPATVVAEKEEGTTNIGSGDADSDGALTAADARALARAALGKADGVSVQDGDFNMDDKVTLADAKILLRAAAGIKPLEELDKNDRLDMSGLGLYDKVIAANGQGYSVAAYNYYFTSLFMSYAQQSYYYDQYYGAGYGAALTGFDYTKSPSDQYVPTTDGKRVTFAEYFNDLAIATIEQYSYYAAQAKNAGLTFDEKDEEQMAQSLEQLKSSAEQYGMTPDALMEEQFGSGMNLYLYKTMLSDQVYAQKYLNHVKEEMAQSVTDSELETAYKNDPNAYNRVSLRAFRLPLTSDEGVTDVQSRQTQAADFMKKVTDEASFVSAAAETDPVNFSKDTTSAVPDAAYETIENAVGKDAANWAFDAARRFGDKQIFTTGNYVYVLFVVSPAARNETKLPSVRHLLVSFAEREEGEEAVTNANGETVPTKEEALALAEKYLAEYNRGRKTEESFAALAEKYSNDKASLSGGGQGKEGGIYADMEKGAFVQEFEDWAYDAARQVGDTGIIESVHGYHIMYFVGTAQEAQWKTVIRAELASEKTDEYMEDLSSRYYGSAVYDRESWATAFQFAVDCAAAFA